MSRVIYSMRSFYDKDDYTIEDIQSLIDNQVEKSIYLDFKSAGSLEKSDRKRMELSKDVASTSPLFQDEVTSIATVPLSFNSSNHHLLWEPVNVHLYYTNGRKGKTFYINEMMDLKGKPLKDWQ